MIDNKGRSSILAEVLSRLQSIELFGLGNQHETGIVVMPVHVCGAMLFVGTALNRNVSRQSRDSLFVVPVEKHFGELGSRFEFDLPIH